MPIEQSAVSLVLREMKCALGENDFGFCLPQGDAAQIYKVEELLKKAGGKPAVCALSDYSGGERSKARPEYIITFKKEPKTLIVVECKRSASKHFSEKLDRPKDYAVDGALYYAKFLKERYNIIAIGVSGTKKDDIKVNAYYWQKGREEYAELKKARDIIYEPLNYLRLVSGEAVKKALSLEEIRGLAIEMHVALRESSVSVKDKPVFIAGILVALKDRDFLSEYPNAASFKSLLSGLQTAIGNVLTDSDIRSEKIEEIQGRFKAVGQNAALREIPLGRHNSLLWYIEQLDKKIKPMMDFADNTVDALGVFYHEFVRYGGGDGGELGIVLTPQHLTEFMCDLAEVSKNSTVIDICCGSGAFLVTAMNKMFKDADVKEVERIRKNALYGVEKDSDIYALAVANMIARGDGRSNILNDDCFRDKIISWLREKNADIGLMNPPYALKKNAKYSSKRSELEFVENMLDILSAGGTGVVVAPTACTIGTKFKEIRRRLFKKHTLKAVFSMPDDIFYSNNANVNVCVMVWEAHKPHDSAKTTFFGYCKDDGFVKVKKLGRVDKFNKWRDIKEEWLRLYRERESRAGLSVKKEVEWNDEWLCEAYMETDYNLITRESFELTVKKNLAYLVLSGRADLADSKFHIKASGALVTANWRAFDLPELFDIERGTRLTKEKRILGDTPLVTAGETAEGVSSYISNDDMQIYSDRLTIDMFCNCFYRSYIFACDDNILVLFPKFKHNKYRALFMAAVISADKYRYAYGRQYRQKNFYKHKIKLPVNETGDPDWRYMEEYIKSLPYSDKI